MQTTKEYVVSTEAQYETFINSSPDDFAGYDTLIFDYLPENPNTLNFDNAFNAHFTTIKFGEGIQVSNDSIVRKSILHKMEGVIEKFIECYEEKDQKSVTPLQVTVNTSPPSNHHLDKKIIAKLDLIKQISGKSHIQDITLDTNEQTLSNFSPKLAAVLDFQSIPDNIKKDYLKNYAQEFLTAFKDNNKDVEKEDDDRTLVVENDRMCMLPYLFVADDEIIKSLSKVKTLNFQVIPSTNEIKNLCNFITKNKDNLHLESIIFPPLGNDLRPITKEEIDLLYDALKDSKIRITYYTALQWNNFDSETEEKLQYIFNPKTCEKYTQAKQANQKFDTKFESYTLQDKTLIINNFEYLKESLNHHYQPAYFNDLEILDLSGMTVFEANFFEEGLIHAIHKEKLPNLQNVILPETLYQNESKKRDQLNSNIHKAIHPITDSIQFDNNLTIEAFNSLTDDEISNIRTYNPPSRKPAFILGGITLSSLIATLAVHLSSPHIMIGNSVMLSEALFLASTVMLGATIIVPLAQKHGVKFVAPTVLSAAALGGMSFLTMNLGLSNEYSYMMMAAVGVIANLIALVPLIYEHCESGVGSKIVVGAVLGGAIGALTLTIASSTLMSCTEMAIAEAAAVILPVILLQAFALDVIASRLNTRQDLNI